jgi:nucleoside-diphosphate-sugar epimerase
MVSENGGLTAWARLNGASLSPERPYATKYATEQLVNRYSLEAIVAVRITIVYPLVHEA